jgi:hypothetical protein
MQEEDLELATAPLPGGVEMDDRRHPSEIYRSRAWGSGVPLDIIGREFEFDSRTETVGCVQ